MDGLVAVALGAGMLAAVNPCGFALLPAYMSLLVSRDDARSPAHAVGRALSATAALTLGFALVFAGFGLLIAPVAASVQQYLPWFTVVLGIALVGLGGWLLAGRTLKAPTLAGLTSLFRRGSAKPAAPRPLQRTPWSMVGFGASYALASLTCTIGPFIAVVVGGFRSGSVLEGMTLFGAYALGMGLIVGALAVATALAAHGAVTKLRSAGAWAPRAAGVVMALAGAYVAYYGWWELRVIGGADPTGDPVIEAAESVQHWLADQISMVGPGGWAAIGGVLVAGVFITRFLRGRASERADEQRPELVEP